MKESLKTKLNLVKFIESKPWRKLLKRENFRENILTLFFLFSIVSGIFFRIYNLNWDGGMNFHPDEGNLSMAIINFNPPLDWNPNFFAYNGLLIFLGEGLSRIFAFVTNDQSWLVELGKVNLILRIISSISSLATLAIFYFLSKKIFSKNWAIISFSLFSTTVGLIQAAHFGVSESLLVLEIVGLSYLSFVLYEKYKNLQWWMVMGIACGLTIATKTTGAFFLIYPFFITLVLILQKKKSIFIFNFLYLIFFVVCTFLLTSPMSVIFWEEFMSSMRYEKSVVDGTANVFYTIQFRKTLDYYFFFKNLHWFTGIFIPTLSIAGIFIWIYAVVKKKTHIASLIFLICGAVYFIYIGGWYAKFIRYLMPLIPFLIISATFTLNYIYKTGKRRNFTIVLIAIVVLLNFVWAFSFMRIYAGENSRFKASDWILQNIPENSKILHEERDVRLPVHSNKYPMRNYEFDMLRIFDEDNDAKLDQMSQQLSNSDYFIIGSKRGEGPLSDLPNYPIMDRFYNSLFDGSLGYQEINEINSNPKLLFIEVNDQYAEETFHVFDHPRVKVFKNEKRLNVEEIKNILGKD